MMTDKEYAEDAKVGMGLKTQRPAGAVIIPTFASSAYSLSVIIFSGKKMMIDKEYAEDAKVGLMTDICGGLCR